FSLFLLIFDLLSFSRFFSLSFLFFFYCYGDHRDLHSFPTRRSSDLGAEYRPVHAEHGADERGRDSRECCRSDLYRRCQPPRLGSDRKSTRLNSSHVSISYAVFCLKKKKKKKISDVSVTEQR